MIKVVSSFHGEMSIFYGLLKAFSVWHVGERLPRPTPAGERVQFHEKMDWQDIVSQVSMAQCIPLDQPERFLVRVNHPISLRINGKQETAKQGEVIEVLNTPDIWPKIACRQLIPLTKGVWSPSRLTPHGQLQEVVSGKQKAEFIKLPDLRVDPAFDQNVKGKVRIDEDYKVHRK